MTRNIIAGLVAFTGLVVFAIAIYTNHYAPLSPVPVQEERLAGNVFIVQSGAKIIVEAGDFVISGTTVPVVVQVQEFVKPKGGKGR
jgi:hypothetical protein